MAKNKVPEDTPLIKQFFSVKAQHPEAVLLYRVGDFYESYSDDAVLGSQLLGIFLFLLFLLLLAQQLTPRLRTFKLFIYLLEERHMIVEFYQIERTVECQFAMSINGIAIGVAILIFHASLPRIVGTIRSIGIHPVENRQ